MEWYGRAGYTNATDFLAKDPYGMVSKCWPVLPISKAFGPKIPLEWSVITGSSF